MLSLLILLIFLASSGRYIRNYVIDPEQEESWRRFRETHARTYASLTEAKTRRLVFEENVRRINEHNARYKAGRETYFLQVNKYADLTDDEFLDIYLGRGDYYSIKKLPDPPPTWTSNPPASLDWRARGYVTRVREQGTCGSCWAFSAVGAFEGQYFRKFRKLVTFSEQQLVDCVYEPKTGCSGGSPIDAFTYIKEQGLARWAAYNYTGLDQLCGYDATMRVGSLSDFYAIPTEDERAMKRALASIGPLSSGLYVMPQMRFYAGGVFNQEGCPNRMNHAVTVVGYGKAAGQKYWLLKNSWGPDWGLTGYFMVPREAGNYCNVATMTSYPVIH